MRNSILYRTVRSSIRPPKHHVLGVIATSVMAASFLHAPASAAPGETPEVLHRWDLSVDPGWEMAGEWAFGVPTGEGGDSFGLPDPTSGATGSNVLGINLEGDFSIELGGPWYLTSPEFDCREVTGTTLHFMRWLNMDWQPYVISTIEVSNDGETWTQIWINDEWVEVAEDAWSAHEFDISAVADGHESVKVRWSYTINAGAWAYSGWNLDDIEITGVNGSIDECPADMDGDLMVQGADLTILLGQWGDCFDSTDCSADLNGDGYVNGADLTLMLGAWGSCF